MLRTTVLAAVVAFLPHCASADDFVAIPDSSTISPSDRYEIVQSQITAKWTFRLDRFCGKVSQLVSNSDGDDIWQHMEIVGLPNCQTDGKPHYQLFTSGIAAKHTFLMNTGSGVTWLLVTSKNGDAGWELFSP
jgi:hypothetical protein